ncbi:MAG TPA: MotA/TolQ/ExbB proton channel family protein [Pirellulaceae bacterium]|nr:MotA/TolQ/ExbB proton channel family protein [Pirellulaceae bacterium]
METIFSALGNLIYVIIGLVAAWGAYCVIVVWNRVKQKQFPNEEGQIAFLEAIEQPLSRGDYQGAVEVCEGDRRAVCQLAQLALENRDMSYSKIKQLVVDRFHRDVLQDLDFRLSWVYTVIKSAPMLGLLGTVMGMMAAFAKLAASKTVEPDKLAGDIQFALITTALGLAIAIPLVLCTAYINVQIRKMDDLVSYGINQFLEIFRNALTRFPNK